VQWDSLSLRDAADGAVDKGLIGGDERNILLSKACRGDSIENVDINWARFLHMRQCGDGHLRRKESFERIGGVRRTTRKNETFQTPVARRRRSWNTVIEAATAARLSII
jgi:hypothetical protein